MRCPGLDYPISPALGRKLTHGKGSDLMGRIAAFNATLFFTSLFGLLASFSNSFPTLCISLFLLGSSVGVRYTLDNLSFFVNPVSQGSMPTDGTLLLEHMPKDKQYLVTALSIFFSFGAVVSAVVALFLLPNNSCSGAVDSPCDVDKENLGWKYLLIALGLIVNLLLFYLIFFVI